MVDIPFLTEGNWANRLSSFPNSPIRVSSFQKLDSPILLKGLALKYVASGSETYFTGKERHSLADNQYVLTNEIQPCHVVIDHHISSKGVCIDLDRAYLRDAVFSLVKANDIANPDKVLDFFFTEELLQVSKAACPSLRSHLLRILHISQQPHNTVITDDVLHDIAVALINDQIDQIARYYKIEAVKPTTRKENFKRIEKVRERLHDMASLGSVHLPDLAREVCLSTFRMHHLFKQAYHCSPYYYFLTCKIQHAIRIRQEEKRTWTEIAYRLGFCDIASFSKAFKKITGVNPMHFEKKATPALTFR